MPLKLTTGGGGSIILDAPSVGTNYTLIAPANNGTLISSATGSRLIPSSAMPAGSVIQTTYGTKSSTFTTNSTSYVSSGLSVSITPQFSNSKVLIQAFLPVLNDNNPQTNLYESLGIVGLTKNSGSTWLQEFEFGWNNVSNTTAKSTKYPAYMSYIDTPSSTSSITYAIYLKVGANWNVRLIDTGFYNTSINSQIATITAMEIAQ